MEISFPAICMTLRHSTQSIQQNNPSHHKLVWKIKCHLVWKLTIEAML